MSGTPIKATVQVSAEVREAARAAREAARQARNRRVEAWVGAARADGAVDEERTRLEARLAVLTGERDLLPAEAHAHLLAARGKRDAVSIEKAVEMAERVAEDAIERSAVRVEMVRRIVADGRLSADLAAMRPAPSGPVRVEALRPLTGRLRFEVADDPGDENSVRLELDPAGVARGRPESDPARCSEERAAAEQFAEDLRAKGHRVGRLERDEQRAQPARRARRNAARAQAGAS
jgi:hypothetical protein